MTKKHFEKAALIAQAADEAHRNATINAFVSLFKGSNERFDEERFRRACEPGANVRARA
jgi:hypothetical protein